MYRFFFKRVLDLIISFIGLLVICPFLFVVWLIIFITDEKNNAFYVHIRPGKNGKLFRLIKFKTMNEKRDEQGNLLPDKDRITPVGRFIRSLSIDELPQILNVLKGDMSLVGPRPLLVEYLPLYSPEQSRRHEVKPGMTGWAQVNGRNSISWEQKFKFDVWYVDNISLWLDIKILFLTVKNVFTRDAINSSETNTMEPFKGK